MEDSNFLDPVIIETLLTGNHIAGDKNPLKIVDLFLEEAPLLLDRLAKGIQLKNYEDVKENLKSLKMISSELGAESLLSLCKEFKLAVKEDNTETVKTVLTNIENAFLKLLNILNVLNLSSGRNDLDSAETTTINNNYKEYILVIDDDPTIGVLLSEHLKEWGYEVEVAVSGLEGLEKASQRLPDLILLDAIMDGIDGFETCQLFKSDQRLCAVPVVMVTSLEDSVSINRAFDAGATNFISKPIEPLLLQNQIRFILRTVDIEKQLRESESKLKISHQLARLGHWRLSARTGTFESSEQLNKSSGNENIQSSGSFSAFLMNIHKEDRAYVLNTIGAALQGQSTELIKYRLNQPDGTELCVEQFIKVLRGATHVESILGTVQDVSRQRDAENMIRQMAYHDHLTSLASRGYFMEHMDEVIKKAKRQNSQLVLFFIDIDGLRDINDSLGHDAGDYLLKKVAQRLKQTIRTSDFVARLGGGEFCILISDISHKDSAVKIATDCFEAVNAPLDLNGLTIKPRISIGIAHYPNDADSKHGLLKAADSAMLAARKDFKLDQYEENAFCSRGSGNESECSTTTLQGVLECGT